MVNQEVETMTKKLQVGITAWTSEQGWRAGALSEQAAAVEKQGFDSYWLPENHFGDQRAIPAPLTLLAAAAASTSVIKLGTVSYLLPIRHPLLAAEEVAVLDQLSGGRLVLGVGRGMQGAMFKAFDLPSKDKRRLFKENLQVMRDAWSGKSLCEGDSIVLAPLPLQKPHPPIWVAAFGPLALQQVGSLGLPYLASPIESMSTLSENYGLYNRCVTEAGHASVKTVPIMRTIFVTSEPALARSVKAGLAASVPAQMKEKAMHIDDWAIVGDASYVEDKLAQYVDTLGLSHLIVRGRLGKVDVAVQQRSLFSILEIAARL